MVLHGERKKEFGESWLIWNFATLDVFVCFYELNGVVIIRPAGDSSRYCCWWGNWSNCMFYMVLPRIYHKYFHCMPGNMSLLLKVSTDVPVKSPFFTCSKYSHMQKKNKYILETITVHSLFNLLFPRNIKLRNKPESCPLYVLDNCCKKLFVGSITPARNIITVYHCDAYEAMKSWSK